MLMCGRFSFAYEDWWDFLDMFGIEQVTTNFPVRYNLAPSQDAPAILSNGKQRRFGKPAWGLQHERWSSVGLKPINTRRETIEKIPTFQRLLRKQRVVIPCTGWYEWHRTTKRPHLIRTKSRRIFPLEGLYETWVKPIGERINSCSLITCKADFSISHLHERMPALATFRDGPMARHRRVQDMDVLTDLLQPFSSYDLEWYPVSDIVGNVRNETPECVQRIG